MCVNQNSYVSKILHIKILMTCEVPSCSVTALVVIGGGNGVHTKFSDEQNNQESKFKRSSKLVYRQ